VEISSPQEAQGAFPLLDRTCSSVCASRLARFSIWAESGEFCRLIGGALALTVLVNSAGLHKIKSYQMPRCFVASTDLCARRCSSTQPHFDTRPLRTTLILVILCISLTEGYAFRCASMCRGLDRSTEKSSCSSWRNTEEGTVPNTLRGNSINTIGRLSGWMRHIQSGVEMLLPWLRVPDTRSGKIKYLDTCLALVSEDAMAAWLERQANVDLSLWGKGKAKAVRDLLKEVTLPSLTPRTLHLASQSKLSASVQKFSTSKNAPGSTPRHLRAHPPCRAKLTRGHAAGAERGVRAALRRHARRARRQGPHRRRRF
jgi:hypothetical protein